MENTASTSDPNMVTKTPNGNDVRRENLKVFPLLDKFGVMDTDSCTVLTFGHKDLNGTINLPFPFSDEISARKWIKEGTVAKLQEANCCLEISFTNVLMAPPKWQTDSKEPFYRNKVYG